jgi:hypothetical protein
LICLEVVRNDRRLCVAGVPEGILSGDLMGGTSTSDPSKMSFTLYVGGISGEDAVEWVREDLVVGDVVLFRVVEADVADQAKPSSLHPPGWKQEGEIAWARRQHLELTRQLRDLEEQYGDRLLNGGGA